MEDLEKREAENTRVSMEATKVAFDKHRESVIERLLSNVIKVEPSLHENYHV